MIETSNDYIRQIKSHFSKRDFIQFIQPLILSMEKEHAQMINSKVTKTIDNIILSSVTTLQEKSCSINNLDYVLLEDVKDVIMKERSIQV